MVFRNVLNTSFSSFGKTDCGFAASTPGNLQDKDFATIFSV